MNPNILSTKLNLTEESDIRLLIEHQENRAILSEYLKVKYHVSQATSAESLENADIIIADEEGLRAKSREIINLKKNKNQLFLPLLLLSRRSAEELSDQFLEIVEKNKMNVLNKYIKDIFPDNNIEEYLNTEQEGSEDEFIIKISLEDKNKWINIRSSEIKFKDTELKILIVVDISKQKKTEEKIRYLSFHDQLTGLYNRNYFREEIKRLNTKRQFPITMIMADINNLKLINDIFGHDKGDQLIRKTANILKNNIREADILARIGGDEFAILLPQTSLKTGEEIIKRIKKSCSNSEIMNIKIRMALGASSKTNINQDINDIFSDADDKMYQDKNSTRKKYRKEIISSLNKHLKEKTDESQNHIEKVKKIALKFAERLKLDKKQKSNLLLLAQSHDIGKISVNEYIFKKESSLNEKEMERLKSHCEYGYHISHSLSELSAVAEEILAHHENWDGSGYPKQLKGKEIPYLARIISIIDAYDMLTNDIPSSKAITKREALVEIKRCAGVQFDPDLAVEFIEMMGEN